MAKKTMSQILYNYEKQLKKQTDKAINDTINELISTFKNDVSEMMKEAADAFYNDYSPNSYIRHKRKPTLANMYKVKLSGMHLSVELGGEFSSNRHRVSNDYIYEKMFKGGWHGGATDNESPETLYYSKWHEGDYRWEPYVFEAERIDGDTPYEIFKEQYDAYIDKDFYVKVKDITKKNVMKIFQGRK